ncbi:mu-protocadherin [Aporhodopirellula aestuarii]|uniref:Mu-protocadherin n=1 Tax=Aporhodopirellula aestuarii TaxID=2950107 RepID=A0ABT0U3I4_9BACT|nr:mu-protocadherin [Aporhodopirellula aestuarii]MCM2371403.1 mu-protocadherin [Aporhodopirellula aestuarii]
MSGAVMLLMAATIGITYGWTPDGGDGVKYIIQIPPDKVEQVVRSGEISSRIPAEVRSHVSEIVVRIGHGSVPRITPSNLSSTAPAPSRDPNILAAADRTPVPIPAMGDPSELRPIRGYESPSTAMMKPAPQSDGWNLPGGFGMTPAANSNSAGPSTNFGQVARETANNMVDQAQNAIDASRQQVGQNFNATTERISEAANSQLQSTANNLRDSASQLFSGNARTTSSESDDPRARLSQNSSSANQPANRPSTDPYARNTEPRAGYPGTGYPNTTGGNDAATTPRSRAGMPSTTTASTSSSNNSPYASTAQSTGGQTGTAADTWYDLRNGSRRRPSTDPVDANNEPVSGGGIAGSNFGRLPAGLQNDTSTRTGGSTNNTSSTQYAGTNYGDSSSRSGTSSTGVDYDPNLSPAQAARLPINGYSFDAENYPVDRQGYRLDSYGRRIDRQGRLLTAVDNMAGPNTPASYGNNQRDTTSTSTYASNSNQPPQNNNSGPSNGATNPYGNNGTYPYNSSQLVQPPLAPPNGNLAGNTTGNPATQYPGQQYPTSPYPASQYPMGGTYPTNSGQSGVTAPGYPQYPDPRMVSLTGQNGNTNNSAGPTLPPIGGGSARGGDDRQSPSDRGSSLDRLANSGSALAGGPSDPMRTTEQVAAQPIFNALLLLSIVANVYLLFWLKNLRLQFRDMVATKRAAAAGSSLATGI